MKMLSLITDFIILNLLTIIFSIPIITSGAAMTALYTVMGRIVRNESYEIKDFFAAFKSCFKQATIAWLLLTVSALAMAVSFVLAGAFGGTATVVISCVMYVLGAVWLIAFSWAIPLLSQFDNKAGRTLSNALLLGVANLPRSIIMGVLNLLPWALLYFRINLFLSAALFWLFLWFSVAAYFNSLLAKKPLAPFREAGLADGSEGEGSVDDENAGDGEEISAQDAWTALRDSFNADDDLAPEEDQPEAGQRDPGESDAASAVTEE